MNNSRIDMLQPMLTKPYGDANGDASSSNRIELNRIESKLSSNRIESNRFLLSRIAQHY